MNRRQSVLLATVVLLLLSRAGGAAQPLAPAAQWLPRETLLSVEVTRPQALLDLALAPRAIRAVTAVPAYQKQANTPGYRQFVQVVEFLESRLGTDWKTAVRTLTGGGITLAAQPDGTVLLLVDAVDEKMLRDLRETIVTFAQGDAANQDAADRVGSVEYRGVTLWRMGKEQAHFIQDGRLVFSNRPTALERVIDRSQDPSQSRLATLPAYRQARQAAGSGAAVIGFVNLAAIKESPPVQTALSANQNPLVSLLLSRAIEAVRQSTWLALGLSVQNNTLSVELRVDGKVDSTSGPAAFAGPRDPKRGAWPNLAVPQRIAGLSLYRDLHGFYAAKDELFPERTSGLIFFENMMGIFFSGRDLTEEVLGQTTPEMRVVVARQKYDPQTGTPAVQFPSFAVVFRLHDPKVFAEVAEEAWQKAVGLINFTRGQQAMPGLIIDRPVHNGTQFTAAHFSTVDQDEKQDLDVRFNFRPALVTLNDFLVLSSTESLARDLIDAIRKETGSSAGPLEGVDSRVDIDGVDLAALLRANRVNLVRQDMVEKGSSEAEAEASIDMLLAIVRILGHGSLQVGSHDGSPAAQLQVELNLPREVSPQ